MQTAPRSLLSKLSASGTRASTAKLAFSIVFPSCAAHRLHRCCPQIACFPFCDNMTRTSYLPAHGWQWRTLQDSQWPHTSRPLGGTDLSKTRFVVLRRMVLLTPSENGSTAVQLPPELKDSICYQVTRNMLPSGRSARRRPARRCVEPPCKPAQYCRKSCFHSGTSSFPAQEPPGQEGRGHKRLMAPSLPGRSWRALPS